jgi:hypothetical protein
MLGSVLSAFTILATIEIALDVIINDPDEINTALAALVTGSTLAAWLLISPRTQPTPRPVTDRKSTRLNSSHLDTKP